MMLICKQPQRQGEMESSSSPTASRPRSARAPPPAPAPTTCAVPGLRAGLAKLCSLSKVCAAPLLEELDGDDGASKPGGAGGRYGYGGYDQRLLLARLFDTVGALKAAYVELQRAHAPCYDAARAASAGEAVASELDAAAALQRLCGCGAGGIGALVNERWARVQGLEAEARRREAGVLRRRRELERLRRENSRLGKLVVKAAASAPLTTRGLRGAAVTPAAVVEQFRAAAGSVRDFADLFAGLLAASAGGGGAAEESAEQRPWKRHSLEAHLWRALLGGGGGDQEELELGGDGSFFEGVMAPRDALDALMRFPSSGFARFCRRSYLRAVPAAAEAAARAWALRVLVARYAGGGARRVFFYARAGSAYAAGYMESVGAAVGEEEEGDEGEEGEEGLRVAFTVTPGVKIGDAVVPARVLLRRRRRRREGSVQVR
ncbi:hypothetical protein BS78_08G020200 [Paspalum vaginatum]|nr:hypothetical protein BS78_08G020200 [Paspalum vaginatum]KAJ1264696.1 hypothetical protein BS78_08G020200 [Paspalum vaginatum]